MHLEEYSRYSIFGLAIADLRCSNILAAHSLYMYLYIVQYMGWVVLKGPKHKILVSEFF